jgi:hypothetical protein
MARAVLHFFLGVVGFLLTLELAFNLLPVSTATAMDYYMDPVIKTYPPRHQWTVSTGWDLRNVQRHRSNNAGFLAHRDFTPDSRAVALIGDSFIEASMLDPATRPGQQLERSLGNRAVFTLGAPGTALLDYAERIRFAQSRYGVRDFVLLMERGDLRQSLCGSGNVHGPCLDGQTLVPRTETVASPGIAKRILRYSASAQYMVGQLKANPTRLWQQVITQSRPVHPAKVAVSVSASATPGKFDEAARAQDAVAGAFFERIKGKVAGKLVIVLDSDRAALYRGESVYDDLRARFIGMARAEGAIVVDTEPLFRAQLLRSSLKLDVGPYDGHLNALAVGLVMQAAAQALLEDE